MRRTSSVPSVERLRFRAFTETYRAKIHKKLRNATDPESIRDVRAELPFGPTGRLGSPCRIGRGWPVSDA